MPRLYGQTEEATATSSSSTSRTGSEYVETEADRYADLEQNVASNSASEAVYQTFLESYDLSKELGDAVGVGGAKSANVGHRVTADRGDHTGAPSVFAANVDRTVKSGPHRCRRTATIRHRHLPWIRARVTSSTPSSSRPVACPKE